MTEQTTAAARAPRAGYDADAYFVNAVLDLGDAVARQVARGRQSEYRRAGGEEITVAAPGSKRVTKYRLALFRHDFGPYSNIAREWVWTLSKGRGAGEVVAAGYLSQGRGHGTDAAVIERAAVADSDRGRGLYAKVVASLRRLIGSPIESDKEMTGAAISAWKRIHGASLAEREGAPVYRLNPSAPKRPRGRPSGEAYARSVLSRGRDEHEKGYYEYGAHEEPLAGFSGYTLKVAEAAGDATWVIVHRGEVVGAGDLGLAGDAFVVRSAALESTHRRRGLYTAVLRALRRALGKPVESDDSSSAGALRAWEKAGGVLATRGAIPVYRLNPGAPRPSDRDLADAVQHADIEDQGWTLKDFDLSFVGDLTTAQLRKYDNLAAWIALDRAEFRDATPAERRRMLDEFRGSSWARTAQGWIAAKKIPPVVLVTAPIEANGGGLYTQIGDGRGRVNVAEATGMRLPVWHLKFRGGGARANPVRTRARR